MAKKEKVKSRTKSADSSKYGVKALMGTVVILVASIALFFTVNMLFPFRRGVMDQFIQDYTIFRIVLSLLITVLSLFLTYVYLKDYLELKNELTLAILLAVVSFLMFGLSSNPALFIALGVHPARLGMFDVIPLIFAAISLAILTWISNK
ncbi:MAG: hypothetical protein ABIG39_07625 [Candidatus Micrarchaeota archaeon]